MGKCTKCAGEGKLYRQDCGAHGLTYACSACSGTGKARTCERCNNPVNGHVLLCAACFDDDAAYDDTECANCGGEGFTYGCSWDWQCDTYDEGEGTCLCTRRCEWCNPAKLTDDEREEQQQLRAIMAATLQSTGGEG